ncbi:MAG: ESX secretion-associated protein EspG [Mycolicibacterium sp.]|uniref:ESX secretion-associated protein EspG n=1 Tax=Mycolicibacterium sp. TaxID=2320850 RepID=UPI003D0C9A37
MTAASLFGHSQSTHCRPTHHQPTHHDDVVAVEVTIDAILVLADRLNLVDFPLSLGIRPNIPYQDQRAAVWDHVVRDLTAQQILTATGEPHPEVAAMMHTLSRPDRTLECRWWRCEAGGKMVRFVLCRRGERHVLAVRDEQMLVLQRVAPQIGLAGMLNVVIGTATPADVEPLTGIATQMAEVRTAEHLINRGLAPSSARIYAAATSRPTGWVEITANERHSGGTHSQAGVGAGVLDSSLGRIVSIPRKVNGELYGSFLPGTQQNLERALYGLMDFLPSGSWFDTPDVSGSRYEDTSLPNEKGGGEL